MNREIDLKWAWEDARGGGFLLLFSAKMFICLSGPDFLKQMILGFGYQSFGIVIGNIGFIR